MSELCRKDGCMKPPKFGQLYCSRDHAPLGNYGVLKSEHQPKSDTTEKFSGRPGGAPSLRSLNGERLSENDSKRDGGILNSETQNASDGMNTSQDVQKLTESGNRENGARYQPGSELESSLNGTNYAGYEIQRSDSKHQLKNLETEQLGSMSLIDDSAWQMHVLMKSAAESTRESIKSDGIVEPQTISAAANCARQIVSLLRLKHDIVRSLKK